MHTFRYQPPGPFEAFWKKSIQDEQTARSDRKLRAGTGNRNPKRFSSETSQFAPPSMSKKPKKKRDLGAGAGGGRDLGGARGGMPQTKGKGGTGSGKSSSSSAQGRKYSGADGKQLKTAKNDSVKAQDKRKKEKHDGGATAEDVSDVTMTTATSPSPDGDDSKMETS